MARSNAVGYFSNNYSSVARKGRDYSFCLTRCCRYYVPFATPAASICFFQKGVQEHSLGSGSNCNSLAHTAKQQSSSLQASGQSLCPITTLLPSGQIFKQRWQEAESTDARLQVRQWLKHPMFLTVQDAGSCADCPGAGKPRQRRQKSRPYL